MDRTLLRMGAPTVSALLLASLAVVTTSAQVAAELTCGGEVPTIVGTEDVDLIYGTNGNDVIHGLGGDDFISGLGGDDIICGGDGEDDIQGDDGIDQLYGNGRSDHIWGGDDIDLICGGFGNDFLYGGAGIDQVEGGPGADRIWGGGDWDRLFGYKSSCPEIGRDLRDIIRGGQGGDSIWGDAGKDILLGQGGPDYIRGEAHGDTIDGGPQDDNCRQGPGTGPVRNCERANLRVWVFCPEQGGDGLITCRVRVKNYGPDATTYGLEVGEATESGAANCVPHSWDDEERQSFPALGRGRFRTRSYTIKCNDPNPDSSEWVGAAVYPDAFDRNKANNKASDVIDLP